MFLVSWSSLLFLYTYLVVLLPTTSSTTATTPLTECRVVLVVVQLETLHTILQLRYQRHESGTTKKEEEEKRRRRPNLVSGVSLKRNETKASFP